MNLLFVRHGKAGEREDWAKTGKSDDLRPLTEKGLDEFRFIAKKLKRITKEDFEVIYSSPFVRTFQTAEVLQKEFKLKVEKCDDLKFTADPEELLDFIKTLNKDKSYIFVGHDPTLSIFISLLIGAPKRSQIILKKGAVAFVSCDGYPKYGGCLLEWLMQPRQLLD